MVGILKFVGARLDSLALIVIGVTLFGYDLALPVGPLTRFAFPSTISPEQIQRAYGLEPLLNSSLCDAGPCDGTGQTVAIFAKGDFDLSDATDSSWRWGLKPLKISVSRWDAASHRFASTPPAASRTLGNTEAVMDIDVVHAIAPGAAIHVYEVFQDTSDPFGFFFSAVLVQPDERVLSISYAGCERLGNAAWLKRLDLQLQALALQGKTVFAGSGDDGKYCPAATATTGVNWPASDPYVTAVGGTSLYVGADGSYQQEVAWDNGRHPASGASGGGQSQLFLRPTWQSSLNQPGSYRLVPDVAAVSDASSNSLAVEDTQHVWERLYADWIIAGGTSLATPLWAGFAAVYNQYAATHGGESLGFANPAIYYLGGHPYQLEANPLRDVTLNGKRAADLVAPAGVGWDLATGWGSFNAAAFIHDRLDQRVSMRATTDGRSVALTVVATGFPPGETVSFTVAPGDLRCSAQADNSGRAKCSFAIKPANLLGGQLILEALDNQALLSAHTTIATATL